LNRWSGYLTTGTKTSQHWFLHDIGGFWDGSFSSRLTIIYTSTMVKKKKKKKKIPKFFWVSSERYGYQIHRLWSVHMLNVLTICCENIYLFIYLFKKGSLMILF
jgi:lipid-A-disaccharide synthase-like uncharacterized protein